jgi:hypothetical protein
VPDVDASDLPSYNGRAHALGKRSVGRIAPWLNPKQLFGEEPVPP